MSNDHKNITDAQQANETELPHPKLKHKQHDKPVNSYQIKVQKLRRTPSFVNSGQINIENQHLEEQKLMAQECSQDLYEEQLEQKTVRQLMNQRNFLKGQLAQLKKNYRNVMDSHNNNEIVSKPGKRLAKSRISTQNKINKDPNDAKKKYKNYQSEQTEKQSLTQLDKIGQNNQRVIKQLIIQYSDYEFMFSGQYREKVDQQIARTKEIIQNTKKQLKSLKKQLYKPIQAQSQIYQKYDREIYDIQVQIKQLKLKNQAKNMKISKMQQKNKQKIKGKQLYQQFLDQYDCDWIEEQQNRLKKWEQSKEKKLKLIKIISSQQKTYVSRTLVKQKQLQQVQKVAQEIKQSFNQISLLIESKKTEIKALKTRQNKKSKRTATQSSLMPVVNRQIFLEAKPEVEKLYRRRIYTQLQNNHYFSSNKVVQRQRQWLDSICNSRFDNLEPTQRNQVTQNVGIRREITKLPSLQSVQLEASMIKNPMSEYRYHLSQTRPRGKPGQIFHNNIGVKQSYQKQIRQSERSVYNQSSNEKYYSTNREKYNQICKILNKQKLDLQEDYDIDELLCD